MPNTTIDKPKNNHASFSTTLEYFDSDLAPMDQSEAFYRLELLNDRDYLLNQFNQESDLSDSWACPRYWFD